MNSRHVIAKAWEFTKNNKPLMWWYAFVPSILTTLIGILYMLYQFFAFKSSPLFDDAEKSFLADVISTIAGFFDKHINWLVPAIIITIIILIFYALLPTLCQGGLIQIIAKKYKGEEVKTSDGIPFGMLVFLPLLEYHLLIKSFSIISLFTEAAFLLRNLGTGAMKTFLPVFILATIIGLILTLIFTYSEFFIVLDKKPVLKAMGRSAKLVVIGWQHTLLIAILMLIISVRVIINIIAVLLVPAMIFFTAGLAATLTMANIGIAIGILFGLFGLFVASYFTGILNVFANAVWTFTFLELMNEKRTQEFMT